MMTLKWDMTKEPDNKETHSGTSQSEPPGAQNEAGLRRVENRQHRRLEKKQLEMHRNVYQKT